MNFGGKSLMETYLGISSHVFLAFAMDDEKMRDYQLRLLLSAVVVVSVTQREKVGICFFFAEQ